MAHPIPPRTNSPPIYKLLTSLPVYRLSTYV